MTNALLRGVIAFGAMVAAIPATAQFRPSQPAGVLGQRYGEISIDRMKPSDELVLDSKNTGGIAFNLPVTSALDLILGGMLGRAKASTIPGMLGGGVDETRRERMAYIGSTAYLRRGAFAPFARAKVGYEWSEEERVWGPRATIPGGRIDVSDHGSIWSIGIGSEIVVQRVAITPLIEYQHTERDLFVAAPRQSWTYSLAGHMWLTKALGGFVQVGHTRSDQDYSFRAWSWGAGVRVAF